MITMQRMLGVFIFLIAVSTAYGQVKGLSVFDQETLFQDELLERQSLERMFKTDMFPTGNTVEPEYYYLGPGDIMSLQNLAVSSMQQFLPVTPEVSVLIPRVGEVSLKGLNLAEARDTIRAAIKRHNPNSIVHIALYQARNVLITIQGNVAQPGVYAFPASYRVSTAINLVNQLKQKMQNLPSLAHSYITMEDKRKYIDKEYSNSGLNPDVQYSVRNIRLRRNDGSSANVDIEKANILRDMNYDPFIREGDVINVPFEKSSFPNISISGAVVRPVVVAWRPEDRASFLLKLGYGFEYDADIDNIKLIIPNRGEIKLKVDDDLNISGEDYELTAGSGIVVGRLEKAQTTKNGFVAITGEVRSPGTYLINENQTKLLDIVQIAGGFTEKAYLPLAYILRRDLDNHYEFIENERMQYFQYSDLSMEDTTRYKYHILMKKPIVSVDIDAAVKQNSERDNIFLSDGDLIVIPPNPKSVYIFGQVNKPGFVAYSPGRDMDWYLEQAGGLATGGQKKRARIIRGKNNVWVEGGKSVIVYSGDMIYVPQPPDLPPGAEMQTIAMLISAISTVTILINVLYGILKN